MATYVIDGTLQVAQVAPFSRGSEWRRWDPHIHAPGTLFEDEFNGDWDRYIDAINTTTPHVEALGVTDYFSLGCYQAVRKYFLDGKLPRVKVVFPNVELRLNLPT